VHAGGATPQLIVLLLSECSPVIRHWISDLARLDFVGIERRSYTLVVIESTKPESLSEHTLLINAQPLHFLR
jgi:hypothetical protein